MEQLNLTVAEVTPAINTSIYKVIFINLDWEQQFITIRLRGQNSEIKSFIYGGSNATPAEKLKATNMMIALNKANLSIKSLQKRVLEQLVSDGFLSGTISGVPD